jgi:hypothetical protein
VSKFQKKEWSSFWKYLARNSSDRLFSGKISCLWQLRICLQLQFNKNKFKGIWTHGTIFHERFIIWTFICDIRIKGFVFQCPDNTTYIVHLHVPMQWNILFNNGNKKADFYWNTWFICWLFVFIIACLFFKSLVLTQTWATRSTGSTWNHDHAANYILNCFINFIFQGIYVPHMKFVKL